METMFTRNEQRAIVAELLGTMFFVLLGTGAVVSSLALAGGADAAVLVAIAMAHGFAIMVAVAWTANLSGGHINPAVSLAMILTKNIKAPLGVAYIVAQFAGAVVGSLLLKWCIPNQYENGLGAHVLGGGIAGIEAVLLEGILTAFLVLVIFNTAVSKRGWGINAPVAIGMAIMVIHFVAVPWTGASVNPARSFGPALVANQWDDFWVYIIGPALGAIVVAAGWLVFKELGDDSLQPDAEPAAAA